MLTSVLHLRSPIPWAMLTSVLHLRSHQLHVPVALLVYKASTRLGMETDCSKLLEGACKHPKLVSKAYAVFVHFPLLVHEGFAASSWTMSHAMKPSLAPHPSAPLFLQPSPYLLKPHSGNLATGEAACDAL